MKEGTLGTPTMVFKLIYILSVVVMFGKNDTSFTSSNRLISIITKYSKSPKGSNMLIFIKNSYALGSIFNYFQ